MVCLDPRADVIACHLAIAGAALPDDYVTEVCRFGAGELHTVGAIIGGIASQEAIKVRSVLGRYDQYLVASLRTETCTRTEAVAFLSRYKTDNRSF